MLPAVHRMRSAQEFSQTLRSGVRSGRRNLVLSMALCEKDRPTVVGFVVSRSVGNAVTRNLVKRRLRALLRERLDSRRTGRVIVVRALPPAGEASWAQLAADVDAALLASSSRLRVRDSGVGK